MRPTIDGSTILVTGGAGFIGSHLVDRLISEGAKEVVVIDNLFLGNEENLEEAASKVTLYRDDAEIFSTLEYIFEYHSIDIVFNCATKALNYSFINPKNAFETNTAVVLNLLELQRKGAFSALVHFSTSEVYGTAVYQPMDEFHPQNPTTTYAAGKSAADQALRSYVSMYGLDAFIVRPFNNYGPRQNYRGQMAGVIPITVWKILTNKLPEIHGDGSQSRDFIYVLDTVDAIIKLYSKLPAGECVNISTNGQIEIGTLIKSIAEYLHYSGEIIKKEARKADVECHIASNKKIIELIDYRLTPFDEGLSQTIDWYVKQIGDYR